MLEMEAEEACARAAKVLEALRSRDLERARAEGSGGGGGGGGGGMARRRRRSSQAAGEVAVAVSAQRERPQWRRIMEAQLGALLKHDDAAGGQEQRAALGQQLRELRSENGRLLTRVKEMKKRVEARNRALESQRTKYLREILLYKEALFSGSAGCLGLVPSSDGEALAPLERNGTSNSALSAAVGRPAGLAAAGAMAAGSVRSNLAPGMGGSVRRELISPGTGTARDLAAVDSSDQVGGYDSDGSDDSLYSLSELLDADVDNPTLLPQYKIRALSAQREHFIAQANEHKEEALRADAARSAAECEILELKTQLAKFQAMDIAGLHEQIATLTSEVQRAETHLLWTAREAEAREGALRDDIAGLKGRLAAAAPEVLDRVKAQVQAHAKGMQAGMAALQQQLARRMRELDERVAIANDDVKDALASAKTRAARQRTLGAWRNKGSKAPWLARGGSSAQGGSVMKLVAGASRSALVTGASRSALHMSFKAAKVPETARVDRGQSPRERKAKPAALPEKGESVQESVAAESELVRGVRAVPRKRNSFLLAASPEEEDELGGRCEADAMAAAQTTTARPDGSKGCGCCSCGSRCSSNSSISGTSGTSNSSNNSNGEDHCDARPGLVGRSTRPGASLLDALVGELDEQIALAKRNGKSLAETIFLGRVRPVRQSNNNNNSVEADRLAYLSEIASQGTAFGSMQPLGSTFQSLDRILRRVDKASSSSSKAPGRSKVRPGSQVQHTLY